MSNANARLEAFCDAVFAIAMTLLIIELRPPDPSDITSTSELWHQLHHLIPSVLAFVLSFLVILITWVAHHATLKLVTKSSPSFIYANGFLLLTVVFTPFPTALLGEFLLTDHASPAVVLYVAVLAAQALGWILLSTAAVKGGLTSSDSATATVKASGRNGYFGCALYSLLAIVALWFPLPVAIITGLTWIFWLALGLRMKHA